MLSPGNMKYSCRARIFHKSRSYELKPDCLVVNDWSRAVNVPFSDILEISVFKESQFRSSRSYWACTIQDHRQTLRLSAAHRAGLVKIQDRTSSYIPFIKEFEHRALAINPRIRFVDDEHRETIKTRASGFLICRLIKLSGRLTRRQAGSVFGSILQWVGWLSRGNRYARRQLLAAYPNLSKSELDGILRGMWDNIGRTFAEYGHIRELMNFSTEKPKVGQVTMSDGTATLINNVAIDPRGALLFAAHLGNWEIPAMAARVGGRRIALLYKRQPSNAMTQQLVKSRLNFAARLIEATPSAPREILGLLQQGWLVGMLVDQHFARGVDVIFFGQRCLVNPIFAILARSQDWPIYGARAVRLLDQRHCFELVGPLECPRDQRGRIDVKGTMQLIVSTIENWIREHPEQWLWIHRLIR